MVTLAPPVDVAAVAAYFADFPPFRRHAITRRPRLRVSRADLRGHDWPATREEYQALTAALAAEERRFLEAMAAGNRHEAGPVAAALCEPTLIRWHHRDRSPLGRARVPGGNCRPGRRKLHVMPDGSLHPCERTGAVMPIGNVAAGIEPSRVRELQQDFHGAVSERCAQCWAVRSCGLCFASQASCSDGSSSPTVPARMCEAHRRSREQQLRLVARALLLPPELRTWLDATSVT
jgi:radical SAM protein with 4Fe4S-binding SPASM domain